MGRAILKFIIILSIASIFSKNAYSQSFDYKENSVYIYNFIKYSIWSPQKTNIQVGVIGNSPVESELKNLLNKKKSGNINYSIKNINLSESKSVDVIIISSSSADLVKKVDKLTSRLPILIISEKENQCHQGACISFTINEDNNYKTEYQLSLRNCKLRGIGIGEQILNNALLTR
jgi:hypothetical protein